MTDLAIHTKGLGKRFGERAAVSRPFGLIALVPLFYAKRAGSWRTAVGGTASVVAAVASWSVVRLGHGAAAEFRDRVGGGR